MKERQKKNVGVGEVGDGTEGRGGRKTGKEGGRKSSSRVLELIVSLPCSPLFKSLLHGFCP